MVLFVEWMKRDLVETLVRDGFEMGVLKRDEVVGREEREKVGRRRGVK
jgi:hypothetical protein